MDVEEGKPVKHNDETRKEVQTDRNKSFLHCGDELNMIDIGMSYLKSLNSQFIANVRGFKHLSVKISFTMHFLISFIPEQCVR